MFSRSGQMSLVPKADSDLRFVSIFGKRNEKEVTWNTPGRERLPKIKVEPMFRDKLERILQQPPPEPDPDGGEEEEPSPGGSVDGAKVSTFDSSTLDTSGYGQYDVQQGTYDSSPARSYGGRADSLTTSDSDSVPVRNPFDIRLYAGRLNINPRDEQRDSSLFDSSTFDTFETYETIAFSAESSVSDGWMTIPDVQPDSSSSGGNDAGVRPGKSVRLQVPSLEDDRRGSIRSNSSKKSVTFEEAPVYIDAEPAPDYEEEQVATTSSAGQESRPQGPTRPKDTIRLREIYGKPIVSSAAVAKVNPIYIEDVPEEVEEEKESVAEPEVALSVKDYIEQARVEKYKLKTDIKNNNQPIVGKGDEPHDIDGIWIIDQRHQSVSGTSLDYELRGYDVLIRKTLQKEKRRKVVLLVLLGVLVVLFMACGIALIAYFAHHASS